MLDVREQLLSTVYFMSCQVHILYMSCTTHTRSAHGLHVAPPLVSARMRFQQINDKFHNVLYGQQRFPRQQGNH